MWDLTPDPSRFLFQGDVMLVQVQEKFADSPSSYTTACSELSPTFPSLWLG